jgi:hypothetical protein
MRRLPSALLAAALTLATAAAEAQPRVDPELLPDLDLWVTSIDAPRGEVRFLTRSALSGGPRLGSSTTPGAPPESSWLGQADIDLLLGYTSGQTTLVQARTRAALALDIQPGVEPDPVFATIHGRHEIYLRHGVGGFQTTPIADRPPRGESLIWSPVPLEDHFAARALGADLELAARADHGRVGQEVLRFDAGTSRFASVDVEAGVWLRRAYDEEQAMVLPLHVRYAATFAERAPGAGLEQATRVGADAGFGFKHYFNYHYHGFLEALGVGWDRFAPVDGPGVDRLALRALHIDDVVFRDRVFGLGPRWLLFARGSVGAQWLTAPGADDERADDEPRRDAGLLTFEAALGARFPLEHAHAELAVGGAREGAASLVAGRFVDRYRVESRAGLVMRDLGIGGEVVIASGWQRDLELDGDYARQLGASSSLWFDFVDDFLSLGVYQRAQNGTPLDADALSLSNAWRHDVGLFLRSRAAVRNGDRFEEGPAGFSPW